MKLLIVTQAVDKNNPILGFFHRWIEEFAKHSEKVTVICLEEGEHNLPENVRVLSLGKGENNFKFRISNFESIFNSKIFKRIKYIFNFYKYIWRERKNYDAVFVHMNPEYVVLGGLLWRLWRKKIGLWYVHKKTNLKLKIAEQLSNIIFSSSSEGFRLKSPKVQYVGHGIDVERFKYVGPNDSGNILHVGRITRIKNIETIIRATGDRNLVLVGGAVTREDKSYQEELRSLIKNLGVKVDWIGALPNSELPEMYKRQFASVNSAPDGGMDKSVLESLAIGCPAFVSNKAFREIYGVYANIFMYKYRDSEDLGEKISLWEKNDQKQRIMSELSNKVRNQYDIGILISKISNDLSI